MFYRNLALRAGLVALCLQPALAVAKDSPVSDPGPRPLLNAMKLAGEIAIKGRLIDPESARFEWPYDLIPGRIKMSKKGDVEGWLSCGRVNSKNRMGGYSGAVRVLIFGRQPDIFVAEIGDPDDISYADVVCRPAIKKGLLPIATTTGLPRGVKPLGFTYQATPIGSVILTVEAGSSAGLSGLKPGMIIESVNGVTIKGLDTSAQLAAVSAPADQLDFGLSNGAKVTVRRAK